MKQKNNCLDKKKKLKNSFRWMESLLFCISNSLFFWSRTHPTSAALQLSASALFSYLTCQYANWLSKKIYAPKSIMHTKYALPLDVGSSRPQTTSYERSQFRLINSLDRKHVWSREIFHVVLRQIQVNQMLTALKTVSKLGTNRLCGKMHVDTWQSHVYKWVFLKVLHNLGAHNCTYVYTFI